jgi:hypothetical protein
MGWRINKELCSKGYRQTVYLAAPILGFIVNANMLKIQDTYKKLKLEQKCNKFQNMYIY